MPLTVHEHADVESVLATTGRGATKHGLDVLVSFSTPGIHFHDFALTRAHAAELRDGLDRAIRLHDQATED